MSKSHVYDFYDETLEETLETVEVSDGEHTKSDNLNDTGIEGKDNYTKNYNIFVDHTKSEDIIECYKIIENAAVSDGNIEQTPTAYPILKHTFVTGRYKESKVLYIHDEQMIYHYLSSNVQFKIYNCSVSEYCPARVHIRYDGVCN